MEYFENIQKRKKKKSTVLLGQNSCSATGPEENRPWRSRAARARFNPDGQGPGVYKRERERGGRER